MDNHARRNVCVTQVKAYISASLLSFTNAKAALRPNICLAHYIMNPNVKSAVFLERISSSLLIKIILQLPAPCLEALALSSL